MRTKGILIEIIVFLYIVLFLYTSFSKISEFAKFTAQVEMSPLLTTFSGIIVWVIPGLEIILSIFLIIPRLRLIGVYSAFALMLIFTLYIATILFANFEIPCSCGGVLSTMTWKEHLIFNIGFLLIGITGIVLVEASNDLNKRRIKVTYHEQKNYS